MPPFFNRIMKSMILCLLLSHLASCDSSNKGSSDTNDSISENNNGSGSNHNDNENDGSSSNDNDNATSTLAIHIHATFHNVGIQVDVTGDKNNNATATLEANINNAGFKPMHPLSKVFLVTQPAGHYPQRFVGSVFSVEPETPVEVRVTISDPDGVSNSIQTASITTRSRAIPTSTGATLHVATTGDNTTGTGSEDSPYLTIQKGIDNATPGDTVLIHSGTYHEHVVISDNQISPTQNYLTIKAANDGDVILDGTDTVLNNPSAWNNEGDNIFSATLNSPNNETYYVGFDGNRMWKYFSLANLKDLIYGSDGGFFNDSDDNKIYAKFPNNTSPTGHKITVSNLKYGFNIFNVNNIVFDGLIFKNFNSGEHSAAIQASDNSNGIWIVNNQFRNMETAIRLEASVVDLVAMKNDFSDQGIQNLDWEMIKEHQQWLERGALYCSNDEYSGYGTIFYDNDVHEMFDGVKIVGQEILTHASNSDVEHNRFTTLSDDGIETDGYSSNVRIQNNRFETMLIGVSVAPALAGPTYINRNLMVDLKNIANTDYQTGAVKFSFGDEVYGDIFIYHNTGATTEATRTAFSVSNEADWTKLVMKNNIWSGESFGIYYYLDNADSLTTIQNYDLLYATSGFSAHYQGEDYLRRS